MTVKTISRSDETAAASPFRHLTPEAKAKLDRKADPVAQGARAVLEALLAGAGIRGFRTDEMGDYTEALVFVDQKRVLLADDCSCRRCEKARELFVFGPKSKPTRRLRWVRAGPPKAPRPPKTRPLTYLPTSEEVAHYKKQGYQVRRAVICGARPIDELALDLLAYCTASGQAGGRKAM